MKIAQNGSIAQREYFSFPDTKLPEDVRQQILGRDRSGDLTQIVQCLADVHRQEVAGDALFHAIEHAGEGVVGLCESLVVAEVGDQHVAGLYFLYVEVGDDPGFQFVDVGVVGGGDQHKVAVFQGGQEGVVGFVEFVADGDVGNGQRLKV